MDARSRTLVALVALSIALVAVAALGATAASSYEISISENVTVPNRTVEVQDANYTITSIAKRSPGEDLTATVNTSSNAPYSLQLRNSDNEIEAIESRLSGNGSATFGTADLDPGLYTVAVSRGGSVETIYPVVIEAYEVSASIPDTAEPGGSITVTANLTEQEATNISAVEFVFGDQDAEYTVAMNRSGGNYSANVSLDGIDAGSYLAYVVVRGENEAYGGKAPIGLSDERSIDVSRCVAGVVSGGDRKIDLGEIQTAVNWWAEGTEVPDTAGKTIGLGTLQDLINAWADDTAVDC